MLEIFSESNKIAKFYVSDKIGKYHMATFVSKKKPAAQAAGQTLPNALWDSIR